MWKIYDENICITDELSRWKAKRTFEELNGNKPGNEIRAISFTKVWLSKFKKRNSFKRSCLFGEFKNANIREIISELPKL